jgi:carboxypeptidase C (cathepsin A)
MNQFLLLGSGLLAALLCIFPCSLSAAEKNDKSPECSKASAPAAQDQITEGTVEVSGERIAYQAIAGTITIGATDGYDLQIDAEGKLLEPSDIKLPAEPNQAPATGRLFYVAYFKKDQKAEQRPITFLFNGGPGSATIWLHMGSFGPKRILTPGDQHLPSAPYQMVNNSYTLLDASDVVFIDAPGAGFSRIYGKDKEAAFWGVDQDAGAFARFIVRFVSKYNRWNSPKYIFGESYGTTRAAQLANLLQSEKHMDLNGVIMLSQILSFESSPDQSEPGHDLAYTLALPTYAATAWYHHRLPHPPASLQPLLTEVETFALGDFSHALAQGTALPDAEKRSIAEKLHEYTGLPVTLLLKANLRINGGVFEKSLQDDQDTTTGRLDTRFSGPTLNPLSEAAEYDPMSASVASAYVATFNDYVRRDLKYGAEQTYSLFADFQGHAWDMHHHASGAPPAGHLTSLNVIPDLATAMKTNPNLKVLLNAGYYDLATPYFAAVYENRHLPIPAELVKNVEYAFYESGHMVYLQEQSLKALHDNVATFIRKTSGVR